MLGQIRLSISVGLKSSPIGFDGFADGDGDRGRASAVRIRPLWMLFDLTVSLFKDELCLGQIAAHFVPAILAQGEKP
jgi:hypothetical protein